MGHFVSMRAPLRLLLPIAVLLAAPAGVFLGTQFSSTVSDDYIAVPSISAEDALKVPDEYRAPVEGPGVAFEALEPEGNRDAQALKRYADALAKHAMAADQVPNYFSLEYSVKFLPEGVKWDPEESSLHFENKPETVVYLCLEGKEWESRIFSSSEPCPPLP